MELHSQEDPLSDDEVFFGKLTLKELKKHIIWGKEREPWSISAVNSPTNINDPNASLKIIQTQSQPNLISDRQDYPLVSSEPDSPCWIKRESNDDSFIKMENMVEKICLSPRNHESNVQLNNTLEVIEYILNNPPMENADDKPANVVDKPAIHTVTDKFIKSEVYGSPNKKATDDKTLRPQPQIPTVTNVDQKDTKIFKNTPLKTEITPVKYTEGHFTPIHTKTKPIFKTPAQPLSQKKPSATSLKKTPSKTNAYQHICSPVASYIKNCPIVPLVKDIHPKRPLPGPSSIPKFVKSATAIPSEKENVLLPSIAYKSAKKTRMIDIPDENKLPQSQWAKKIASSLPKPMVIKHNHRETNLAKKVLTQQHEDSFANLSYHQAELSVCTQKSAFKSNNNNV